MAKVAFIYKVNAALEAGSEGLAAEPKAISTR
jgi:hypothetical protein